MYDMMLVEENTSKAKIVRKLHVKIPNRDGKISIDKSQEDIAARSRVARRIKVARRGDKGMKFSVKRMRRTKREAGMRR